jgi:glyoxylate carboligase
MSKKVADVLWEMLAKAGVKRCYGIVGDALNPIVDALRRNGTIEFVLVRHEEYGYSQRSPRLISRVIQWQCAELRGPELSICLMD